MNNMKLWQEVCVTDPAAVKRITGKPYQGNSPKPYWLIQRATEVFGPCGIGWGVEVKSEGFHRMTESDVMHTAVVVVWYMLDGKRGSIEQMGQTKACYAKSGGGMMLDEDAGKKSVTDGMVKCLSMIGFAGDIFSGQWDDSKYVEWAAGQTEARVNPPSEKSIRNSPTMGVFESLPKNRQSIIVDVATAIKERFAAGDVVGAYEEYLGLTDVEEKTGLWSLLDSKVRSAIKKHGETLKG